MTKIEWTDETWNPIVGCAIVSPGCTHCYAMAMAARIEAKREPQLWALSILARDGEQIPALLGQKMMDRPGAEERRRSGNRGSAQGLGRVGGLMGTRLVKAGLAARGRKTWPGGVIAAYGYRITPAGRAALAGEER